MHKLLVGIAVATILTITAQPASAQRRVPEAGMWGLGGSIGASAPADASLQNGIDLAGNIERYLTPRVSIRGQVGASWWDVQGRGFNGTITPFFADANAVYNWEGGALHPYLTGGVGLYRFHSSINGTQDRSDTKPGFNVGGGLEYFLDRRTTMGGELLYHKVGAFDSLVTFGDGSFWRFGFGVKRYL